MAFGYPVTQTWLDIPRPLITQSHRHGWTYQSLRLPSHTDTVGHTKVFDYPVTQTRLDIPRPLTTQSRGTGGKPRCSVPRVGLEPTTHRFTVERATDRASPASLSSCNLVFLKMHPSSRQKPTYIRKQPQLDNCHFKREPLSTSGEAPAGVFQSGTSQSDI